MTAERVVKKLIAAGLTIGLAESCTGGLLAAALTDIPGSSACFGLGVVSYSNQAKNRLLGVPQEVLDKYGAVSPETALAMARGIRALAGADIGLAVSGIAGPSGGSPEKPVGLVYIAIATKTGERCERNIFRGSRREVRSASRSKALAMVLRLVTDETG